MNEPYAGTSRPPRPRLLDRALPICRLARSGPRARSATIVALLAVSLAACGTTGSGQTVAGASATPTPAQPSTGSQSVMASPSPTPPAAPSATPSPSASASQREFAQIESTDAGHRRIVFDRTQLFMGNAATVAARQDHVITATQELPEPLYVRDLHQRATLSVASNALVSVISTDANGSPTLAPVDAAAFLQNFSTFDQSPYFWLTVVGGQVTRIDQQYVG